MDEWPTRPPASRQERPGHGDLPQRDSKVIVQGITGSEGTKHSTKMLAAGTNIVGGVNARKAGTTVTSRRDSTVFGSVEEAIKETGADVSVTFVPPPSWPGGAVIEAIDAEIGLCVVITEGIPVHDSAYVWAHACARGNKTRIIGPELPRHHQPWQVQRGHHPGRHHRAGPDRAGVQVGPLTYQMMYELRDLGFSTAIGIGGDPIVGPRTSTRWRRSRPTRRPQRSS